MKVFRNPYVVTCAPCVRACVRAPGLRGCAATETEAICCGELHQRGAARDAVVGFKRRWLGCVWRSGGCGGREDPEQSLTPHHRRHHPTHPTTTLSSSSSIRLCVWVAPCSSSSNELTGANKSVNGESLLPSTRVRASQVTTFQTALFFSIFIHGKKKKCKIV